MLARWRRGYGGGISVSGFFSASLGSLLVLAMSWFGVSSPDLELQISLGLFAPPLSSSAMLVSLALDLGGLLTNMKSNRVGV